MPENKKIRPVGVFFWVASALAVLASAYFFVWTFWIEPLVRGDSWRVLLTLGPVLVVLVIAGVFSEIDNQSRRS